MRPPTYDDPAIAVPPASAEPSDYPLAAAFVPADPSNYTSGGISSYDYVVVHTMQGYYGGSISWFQNPAADVSAHYCMRSEDGEVTQMVHDDDRAWHVGNSNPYALGIEHEGFVDDPAWYTWEMYASSAKLARWLCEAHGIPVDRDHIVGHVELPNQTHTDPGSNWDWDLYMALVHDVVPSGRIEGAVVDASTPCTVTATVDTWLKRTLEPADALPETEKCFLPAGTELDVQWLSGDMNGHARVTMEAAPCSGELATEAFATLADLEGVCAPEELGLSGVTVSIAGIGQVVTDDAGRFVFDGVGEGAAMLDASLDGFVTDAVPVMLDAYPGARVVIALEPTAAPGGDDGASGGESGGPVDDGSPAETGDGQGGSDPADPDDEDTGGSAPTDDGVVGALPDTFGASGDAAGCSCRASASERGPWGLALGLLGLVAIRRRLS